MTPNAKSMKLVPELTSQPLTSKLPKELQVENTDEKSVPEPTSQPLTSKFTKELQVANTAENFITELVSQLLASKLTKELQPCKERILRTHNLLVLSYLMPYF